MPKESFPTPESDTQKRWEPLISPEYYKLRDRLPDVLGYHNLGGSSLFAHDYSQGRPFPRTGINPERLALAFYEGRDGSTGTFKHQQIVNKEGETIHDDLRSVSFSGDSIESLGKRKEKKFVNELGATLGSVFEERGMAKLDLPVGRDIAYFRRRKSSLENPIAQTELGQGEDVDPRGTAIEVTCHPMLARRWVDGSLNEFEAGGTDSEAVQAKREYLTLLRDEIDSHIRELEAQVGA